MLKDILDERRELAALEQQIKDAKQKYGIDLMEQDLKRRQATIKELLVECVEAGDIEDGTVRIVDRGRSIRHVNIDRMKYRCTGLLDDLYMNGIVTVPVGILEKYLVERDGKEAAAVIMSEICDVYIQHSYDIIDLLEG